MGKTLIKLGSNDEWRRLDLDWVFLDLILSIPSAKGRSDPREESMVDCRASEIFS